MSRKTMLARIAAAVCTAALGCTMLTGCDIAETVLGPSYADQSDAATETSETDSAVDAVPDTEPTTEPETEAPTVHVSPVETVTTSLGAQLETDAYLNKDSSNGDDKVCKVSLSNFIQAGDKIDSFVFVFYADGNIGTYQGGCGISVTDGCPSSSDGWYESPNFEASTQGGFAEIRWNVPGDIKPYIDPDGEVQIGYWWGDVSTVHLSEIICNYTRSAELPVDNTTEIPVGQDLYYADDEAKYAKVPVGRLFDEDGIPQAVTYHLSSSGGIIKKFVGGFTAEGGGEPYTSDNIAILTDASDLSLTWILPENARHTGITDLGIGCWWSEQNSLTLDSITVKYSTGNTPGAAPAPAESSESTSKEDTPVISSNSTQAAQIAADIRVGWNLGNTLDCYDDKDAVKPETLETYWGNVKTTKATIDAVRAKGFNAVRIPVTWGNHMDASGTIDSAWMDRVQEVVDYAAANDMYIILNTHHEDALWMHPSSAEESVVTERFVRAWEQIADRFKDYDSKLLFEGLNEPRIHGTSSEWMGGTSEERKVINHMQERFVSTVRASGGNNAQRTLIVTTHAASITDAAISGLELPDDDNIIVSIHNYAPWKLTTKEYPEVRSFDQAGKDELNGEFDKLKRLFIDKGVPVIITEFGAEDKGNTPVRAAYYAYYIKAAAERGIPCFIWDNGAKSSYGLLNRGSSSWFYPEIADAVMNAVS
ncbi:MAG: cellulase family glycosylhydrolase [Oscillospiraceae bacterium]|nr:cellulase family glycosylhydrolase [Oscillospiraceae bacterium]